MPDRSIDWLRWLVYLLAGVPLVVWVFFARDRVLRLVSVLGVTIFIQDSLAGRRYFWAFSLAPSLVVAYVALLSQVLERRRLPSIGVYGPLWLGLLFAGAVGVLAGSLGTGLLQVNVKEYQASYLEGLVFFLLGVAALRTPEELRDFFRWMVAISVLLALQHFFVSATGYHFRGSARAVIADIYYAGVLDNGNSLGSYWVLGIPTTLAIALSRDSSQRMRTACYAGLVLMLGSLLLTGSRGGLLFTVIGCGLLVFTSGVHVGRLVIAGFLALVMAGLGYLMLTSFLAAPSQQVFDLMQEEGLESNRLQIFASYASMLIQEPFGLGLAAENMKLRAYRYGILATSAHNIYLDIGAQTGLAGLAIFVAMAASFVLRNRRAARLAPDPVTREGLGLLFLCLAGYLGVGFFEPIYTASTKLNNLYWLLAGLSVGAANRVFEARRSAQADQLLAGSGAVSLSPHAPRI